MSLLRLFIVLAVCLSCSAASAGEKWKEKRSEHFIVYYKDVPRDFIKEVVGEAERYYVKITRNLGFTRYKFWLWDNRAKFYIYNDKEDYVSSTHQPAWSGGVVHYQNKIIRAYPQSAGFFDSLMPHELGHIVFREFIGDRARVPLWLEEGVASYQERAKRVGADAAVKAALADGRFMALDKLSAFDVRKTKDKEVARLFYSEAISAVSFLIDKFGKGRFVWFCRDLRDGKTFKDGLWRFGCRDLKCLNKKWLRYLEGK
ncbi:MAG: peptidase MA family metallohydrolase [Candidatus Omnitrophota bacterium]